MAIEEKVESQNLSEISVQKLSIVDDEGSPQIVLSTGRNGGVSICIGGLAGSAPIEMTVERDGGDVAGFLTLRRLNADGEVLGAVTVDGFALCVQEPDSGGSVTFDGFGVTRRHPTKDSEDRELYRRAD